MERRLHRLLDIPKVRYWDFREGRSQRTIASAWNGQIKTLSTDISIGSSLRVLYGNSWSFQYSEKGTIDKMVKNVIKIAKALEARNKKEREIQIFKPIRKEYRTKAKIHPDDISMEEKKDLVLKNSKPLCDRTSNNHLSYSDFIKDSVFYNSEGSRIEQHVIRTMCGASVTVKDRVVESYDQRLGESRGYELTKFLVPLMHEAHKKAIGLLSAKVPKGGRFPVICDSKLTDVFIHEAVGHATEADLVMQNESCLKDKLGQRIAPEIVNVIDDATQKKAWGAYGYDDEGIKSSKSSIIKDGILNTFLHSRETAATMGKKPTGNGRAEGVGYLPMVRMSNTFIKTGDATEEELFDGIKYGFYLQGSKGGEVDTAKGNFQFSAVQGYLIENGEKTKLIKGVSMGGNTMRILADISKIGKERGEAFPGFCGKSGQAVPVGGNSPMVLIEKARVGGK